MEKPNITKDCVKQLLDTKYLKAFDLQYAEGRHYFVATRREKEDILSTKSDEELTSILPDAVSAFLIVRCSGCEPKMWFSHEFRYPTGQFVLSIVSGLIDNRDLKYDDPVKAALIREIKEETGITVKESDSIELINPFVFNTPGFTDESQALLGVVVDLPDLSELTQKGAEGSEVFNGYELYSKAEVSEILKTGRDKDGHFYPLVTWASMVYFLSDIWDK